MVLLSVRLGHQHILCCCDSTAEIGVDCVIDLLKGQITDLGGEFCRQRKQGLLFDYAIQGTILEFLDDSVRNDRLLCEVDHAEGERIGHCDMPREVKQQDGIYSRHGVKVKPVWALFHIYIIVSVSIDDLARFYIIFLFVLG